MNIQTEKHYPLMLSDHLIWKQSITVVLRI